MKAWDVKHSQEKCRLPDETGALADVEVEGARDKGGVSTHTIRGASVLVSSQHTLRLLHFE